MTLAKKRVLLTGANGFVGGHLGRELRDRGAEVLTLADPNGRAVDVRDWDSISEFGARMGKVDLAYHLAAVTFVPYSFERPRDTFEVNVTGTLNVLELCRVFKVERTVFASSYVYGPPRYLPVDELHPLNPVNPYSRSKIMGESLCSAYHDDFGLKCVILRPFNIYGEGQSVDFLIPSILKQAAGARIELMDPEPRRDYLYIDDAIDAYIRAGEYPGTDSAVFNIGLGLSYSVSEIVRAVLEGWGREVEVSYQQSRRKNEIMDVVANVEKAKRELGWIPKVGFKEGLRRYIEWFKAQSKADR